MSNGFLFATMVYADEYLNSDERCKEETKAIPIYCESIETLLAPALFYCTFANKRKVFSRFLKKESWFRFSSSCLLFISHSNAALRLYNVYDLNDDIYFAYPTESCDWKRYDDMIRIAKGNRNREQPIFTFSRVKTPCRWRLLGKAGKFERLKSKSHSISAIEWATSFLTPRPVNSSIGKLEVSIDRATRPLRTDGNWIRRITRTRKYEFVKAKVRRRKLVTTRDAVEPIAIGYHLSDGALQTREREKEREKKTERERESKWLRFPCQTNANQTKPKPERLGTNQLSQAHPQLAKRQTYLIQLLAPVSKKERVRIGRDRTCGRMRW